MNTSADHANGQHLNGCCFGDVGELMAFEDALRDLHSRLRPMVGIERVALAGALGRVLAKEIVARTDVPAADNSAVDGYAVAHQDLHPDRETRLKVTLRIAAGHPAEKPARAGEAARIFTGAPLPDGYDTVFMQEDVRLEGDDVILPPGQKKGANRRLRGEDLQTGKTILHVGKLLRAQEVGLAATAGYDQLDVYAPLRVAVFSTGDEVLDPGQNARPGSIFDANRYTVMALVQGLGASVTDLGILPDKKDAIEAALSKAAQTHDVLLTSGGVSMGDEDHVKDAVRALGEINFWRLAIKPGRPIALGQVGDAVFVGLPGNPVAAMVTFMMIARAVVLRLAGREHIDPVRYAVRAGFDMDKKPGRREWLRARLVRAGDGGWMAERFAAQGSGVLTSMVQSDGLVELHETCTRINKGDLVDFIPFFEVAQ